MPGEKISVIETILRKLPVKNKAILLQKILSSKLAGCGSSNKVKQKRL